MGHEGRGRDGGIIRRGGWPVLPRSFYARPADEVARDLLGATLVHGSHRVRIVEIEAYLGPHDQAAHSSKGRTPRTEVMFGTPGHAYVYFVYGMHHMFNVVCQPNGTAAAVLIRAAEALGPGLPRLDGPARLAKALGITVQEHNGMDLCGTGTRIEVGTPPRRVVATPRIGVDYAGEWAAAPLRFVDADSPSLSRPLPSSTGGT